MPALTNSYASETDRRTVLYCDSVPLPSEATSLLYSSTTHPGNTELDDYENNSIGFDGTSAVDLVKTVIIWKILNFLKK